ncbi:MAG: histidine phosphatase family protein [Clostridia bacterium]|nr:histidine phosphatase family protein [Clostridia bacterium]
MKLYVIRHGQTDCNIKLLFNGRFDEDINDKGIMQANEASKIVKDLDIDIVICSPLLRTRHTAEIVNVNNAPIEYNDLLMERDYGSLTKEPVKSVDRNKLWYYNEFEPYEGVEPVNVLFERVRKCLDDIKKKYPDKNILIVTHGGVTRAIYAYFNEIPEGKSLVDWGHQDNCEIREYEW